MDNPEVCSHIYKAYNKLVENRSEDPGAVTVISEISCSGKKKKATLPFKVKLNEYDIAFIRGITETIQDIEAILNLGSV